MVKTQTLLRATRDRRLWGAMIAHITQHIKEGSYEWKARTKTDRNNQKLFKK